ncbi:hypothetical protein [Butyrivibrio sp. XPD2002]|uniref:hypothetical protein n=1 Tax=Butyrivibrio sp. XPD2002 TaxID=1280665 RepID=UPI000405F878|nr:hypothetical protein [Butyrivibrio sp. XPD2002]
MAGPFSKDKEKILAKPKVILSFFLFLCIVVFCVNEVSYIFRYNYAHRDALIGFENEDHVNVVFVGGSNVRCAIQPLEGWKEYGITSYNYAANAAKFDLFPRYMDVIRKYNSPELFVIDLRTLPLVVKGVEEKAIRGWADCYDIYDPIRIRGICDYFFRRDYDLNEIPSFFLDIMRFHTQDKNLGVNTQWAPLKRSEIRDITKGADDVCEINAYNTIMLTPEGKGMSELQMKVLKEVLDYCDNNHLNALFICTPYILSKEDYDVFDAAEKIISERGYTFQNLNDHCEEIGIDFNTHFCDVNHTNYLGAKAVSAYIFNYLSSNYSFSEQSAESAEKWNDDYSEYSIISAQRQSAINALKDSLDEAKESEKELVLESDFRDWLRIANMKGFSLVLIQDKSLDWDVDNEDFESFLDTNGIILNMGTNVLTIRDGKVRFDYRKTNDNKGTTGNDRCPIDFSIIDTDDEFGIDINGVGVFSSCNNALRILVINNQYRRLVDDIIIENADGDLAIEHIAGCR